MIKCYHYSWTSLWHARIYIGHNSQNCRGCPQMPPINGSNDCSKLSGRGVLAVRALPYSTIWFTVLNPRPVTKKACAGQGSNAEVIGRDVCKT